jgi:hypothetical protein
MMLAKLKMRSGWRILKPFKEQREFQYQEANAVMNVESTPEEADSAQQIAETTGKDVPNT